MVTLLCVHCIVYVTLNVWFSFHGSTMVHVLDIGQLRLVLSYFMVLLVLSFWTVRKGHCSSIVS
jgi:hypothetical protein